MRSKEDVRKISYIKTMLGRAFVVFIVVALASAPARAGWIDDWFTQATTTSPSSYAGQQRGYLTGGGVSARFPHQTLYPITAVAPSFNVGCGGIDFYAGGFSFLNTNYLVSTMQNMVSAAPAVAFDLAMSTLAPQISESLGKFKAIIDRLNNVQLNGCEAGKAIVTMAADTMTGNTQAAQDELTKLATTTGIYDLYNDSKDALNTGSATTMTTNTKIDVTGGDVDIDALLYQPGSYLEKAVNTTQVAGTSWNTQLTDIARGYVGDFYTAQANDLDSMTEIAPCPDNKWVKIWEDLKTGNVKTRPASGGNCALITDFKNNMSVYTRTMMDSIANKMRNSANVVLTPDEEAFVRNVPFPVFIHLKMAVSDSTDMVNAYEESVNDIVAEAFSVNIMINLFEETEKMLVHYKDLIIDKKVNTGTKDGSSVLDGAIKNLDTLIARLDKLPTNVLMKHFRVLRLEYETVTTDLRNRSNTFDRVVAGVLKIPED